MKWMADGPRSLRSQKTTYNAGIGYINQTWAMGGTIFMEIGKTVKTWATTCILQVVLGCAGFLFF